MKPWRIIRSAALVTWCCFAASRGEEVTVVDRPETTVRNRHYVANREPLSPAALVKLPVGAVRPRGWLLEYLHRQRDGLTGHLGEISAWLNKEGNAWLNPQGEGKWGWEEVPYWLKGYGDLGYLLDDETIISETKVWLEAVLASQRADGDFGPQQRFKSGHRDYWANMIMLFCLQSYHEYSGDPRVLELMTRYFRHQLSVPDEALLSGYWDKMRGGDNLASIYWLYNRTGDAFLLQVGEKIHRCTANWKMKGTLPNWHNVNVAQCFREPAEYFQQSHDASDLQAAYDNFRVIRERFGQMPGGMFAADEIARPGHDDPHQCVETCGMVEQMLSDEMLLAISGDLVWADHCEDVAFNTYPAAVMPDFKAFRYLTGANQVTSDSTNHAPGVMNGGPFFMMNPFSNRCCQHNHSHGWPYFAEHLWMATQDNGLAAVFLCAGTVTARVGAGEGGADAAQVSLETDTRYPFEEQISWTVHAKEPVAFPLYLRVPGWCSAAKVTVNHVECDAHPRPGQYVRILRTWREGDTLSLAVPMAIQVRRWERNHGSVSIDRGPLTFSLRIEEKLSERSSQETALPDSRWRDDVDVSQWPSWEIQPASAWNYGLLLDAKPVDQSFSVQQRPWPADNMPFTLAGAPIELVAKGRRIANWKLDQHQLAGELQDSPVRSEEPDETIRLIPMGAARLRISAFPVIGSGPRARDWSAAR